MATGLPVSYPPAILPLMEGENTLLTVSDAADLLDLTANAVRRLSDRGDIATLRTASGIRLFRLSDVQQLAIERQGKSRTGRPRRHPIRRDRQR